MVWNLVLVKSRLGLACCLLLGGDIEFLVVVIRIGILDLFLDGRGGGLVVWLMVGWLLLMTFCGWIVLLVYAMV